MVFNCSLSQQQIPRCLLSRLENVPSKKLNPRIRDASENKCVANSEMDRFAFKICLCSSCSFNPLDAIGMQKLMLMPSVQVEKSFLQNEKGDIGMA